MVKLVDFGACQKLEAPGAKIKGHVCSPLYMSPELCLDGAYDERHDVWALGAILYLLATMGPEAWQWSVG